MTDYRAALAEIAPGMDISRYYDGFRLVAMLWRSLWYNSDTDWGRYRIRIWGMFTDRVQSAARTTGNLASFLSRIAKMLDLSGIGVNDDDRAEMVRRWRDVTKDEVNDDLTMDTKMEAL